MIKIGIHGASGKMGKTIAQCLEGSDEAVLSALRILKATLRVEFS